MAINWDMLKAQYLQANRVTQLGSLALNLTRIHLLALSGTDGAVARHLVRESQFFIEWTVPTLALDANPETDLEFAVALVDLQRLLSRWKLGWADLWASERERQEMAALAQDWCDRIHAQCGLRAG